MYLMNIFLLVGYGEINKFLFSKLKYISKNITIISKSKREIKKYKYIYGLEKLEKAVENKNFIINTLPSTKETKNIFSKKIFKKFKKKFYFYKRW